jgi:hypothetical protein
MNSDLSSTIIPQSDQTRPESDAAGQGTAPTFQVQTGVRAGRFGDRIGSWWQGFTEGMAAEEAAYYADRIL